MEVHRLKTLPSNADLTYVSELIQFSNVVCSDMLESCSRVGGSRSSSCIKYDITTSGKESVNFMFSISQRIKAKQTQNKRVGLVR